MSFFSTARALESGSYNIYYLPLEAEFYIPPTREYIMQHGINIEMKSCLLDEIFKKISDQEGVVSQSEDLKRLRIMIVDKCNGTELFVTSEKKVLTGDKSYNIGIEIISEVLKEIAKE